jgi:hypothetical protein
MPDFAAEAVPLTEEDVEIFDPLKSGFIWYTPPLASEVSHTTGGQEWSIAGHDMQILTMTVPPGETVTTEVKKPHQVLCVECNLFSEYCVIPPASHTHTHMLPLTSLTHSLSLCIYIYDAIPLSNVHRWERSCTCTPRCRQPLS